MMLQCEEPLDDIANALHLLASVKHCTERKSKPKVVRFKLPADAEWVRGTLPFRDIALDYEDSELQRTFKECLTLLDSHPVLQQSRCLQDCRLALKLLHNDLSAV